MTTFPYLLNFSHTVVCLLALVLLAACVPVRPHWLEKNSNGDWVRGVAEKRLPRNLKVIEFDELGDLWSSGQRDDAIRRINTSQKPPLVVTFIHGWRHSAYEKDANFQSFQRFLGELEKANLEQEIIGIYIGWRGGSAVEFGNANLLAPFTIFSRKDATDRLAGVPLGETLWRIKEVAKRQGGNSVLLGHSLGGRTIERCVGQYIVAANHRSDDKRSASQRVRTDGIPADLIVLINPASESLYAYQMKQALEGWGDRTPAIISVTADSDLATNKIWGIAMYLSSITHLRYGFRKEVLLPQDDPNRFREGQCTYLTRTAGHDDRLIDWDVRPAEKRAGLPAGMSVIARNVTTSAKRNWFWIAPSSNAPALAYQLTPHTPRDKYFKKQPYGKINGYWVLSVDSSILVGHGGKDEKEGVFNTPMIHLMSGLFGLSRRVLGNL